MPKRKKYNSNKFTASVCDTDIDLADYGIISVQTFSNDLVNKYNEKFSGSTLDDLTTDEKIISLSERYQFYRNFLPLQVDTRDNIALAKNNMICSMMESVRKCAVLHKVEKEVSIHMTKTNAWPMYGTLLKYNKDIFQYIDEMSYLENEHDKLSGDPNLLQILHPKIIIHNYDKYESIKPMLYVYCLESSNTRENSKLVKYVENFDKTFPSDFCKDLYGAWNSQSL